MVGKVERWNFLVLILLCPILFGLLIFAVEYTKLYNEKQELEKRLNTVTEELRQYKETERQEKILAREFGIRNPSRSLAIARSIRKYYIDFIKRNHLVNRKMTPEQKTKVSTVIYDESIRQDINPLISGKVCYVESYGGDPTAVSPAGAKGLFQLMDPTTRDFAYSAGVAEKNWSKSTSAIHSIAFDPIKNAKIGIYYLAYQKRRTKYWLEAYNGGMKAAKLASQGLLAQNHESYQFRIKIEGETKTNVRTEQIRRACIAISCATQRNQWYFNPSNPGNFTA